MTQADDTKKNLENAKRQLAQHVKKCDLCKNNLRCSVKAGLEQLIELTESWLNKQSE